MKMVKAGAIAGIVGVVITIIDFFIMLFLSRMFVSYEMAFVALVIDVLTFAIPGALAGVFASRRVTSARESLIPGLIAGVIVAFTGLLELSSLVFPVMGGQHGTGLLLAALPGFLIGKPFMIALAGLCSALAVFFTRELYWSIPAPNLDNEPGELKRLYDELWTDARTMVVDMNRSIRVYLFSGILLLIFGLMILYSGIAGWQHIRSTETNSDNIGHSTVAPSDYLVVICEIAAGLVQLLASPYLLYWYHELKKRYSRLMLVEKTIGA